MSTTPPDSPSPQPSSDPPTELTQKFFFHSPQPQHVYPVTKDHVVRVLTRSLDRIENRPVRSVDSIVTALVLAVTLILTLASAKFHKFFLPASVWVAVFVLLLVASIVWAIWEACRFMANREVTIVTITEEIVSGAEGAAAQPSQPVQVSTSSTTSVTLGNEP